MHSEYLTWYVLNDESAKKGCVDILSDIDELDMINLSIDYQEDYDRCLSLLNTIDKSGFNAIKFADLIAHLDQINRVDGSKVIKLPEGKSIVLKDYIESFKNLNYHIRKEITV